MLIASANWSSTRRFSLFFARYVANLDQQAAATPCGRGYGVRQDQDDEREGLTSAAIVECFWMDQRRRWSDREFRDGARSQPAARCHAIVPSAGSACTRNATCRLSPPTVVNLVVEFGVPR